MSIHSETTLAAADEYRTRRLGEVPGWLHQIDADLFADLLTHQLNTGITGSILEIGTYHGKSAILLGYGLREREDLVACDLFGAEVPGLPTEGMAPYAGLSEADFRRQYGRFHEREPLIHACPSEDLDDRLFGTRFRFIHVDGGHAYEVVMADIEMIRVHTRPGCVVVVDDFRTSHTPGVSAAVWEAVSQEHLYPFLISPFKLYAATTLADQKLYLEACRAFNFPRELHVIRGLDVLRMWR